MCGLVGVIPKGKVGFSTKDVTAFEQLLFADQLRGMDGTGMFFNTKRNKAQIGALKAPYHATVFCKSKEFQDASKTLFSQSNFAIGHNRAATKGKVDTECTHPFKERHITLVHNGTLNFYRNLATDAVNDSHSICKSIAEKGHEKTLKDIDGAFALIWFNSQNKTLNLCRNSQRPLYIVEFEDQYIIASEAAMAVWIGSRNGFKYKRTVPVETETLYKFKVQDMSVWEEEKVEYKKFYQNNYNGANYAGFGSWKDTKETSFRETKVSYKKGDLVRFRSGFTRSDANGQYIEGDVLRYQSMVHGMGKLVGDFEDRWRIRVYAPSLILNSLKNSKDLIGKIAKVVVTAQNFTYYVVEDAHIETRKDVADLEKQNLANRSVGQVIPFDNSKGTAAPAKEKSKEGAKCEWCGEPSIGFYQEYGNLCGDCCASAIKGWGGSDSAAFC